MNIVIRYQTTWIEEKKGVFGRITQPYVTGSNMSDFSIGSPVYTITSISVYARMATIVIRKKLKNLGNVTD